MSTGPGSAERVYRGILGLYPTEFRRRHGDDMVQLFHDKLRDTRSGSGSWGAVVVWIGFVGDVVTTAPLEHLRRNRTMAHSLTSAPSLSSRVLGLAGIAAGLAILAAFVIDLPSGLFRDRLVVFGIGVIAIAIGVHRRQANRARAASLVTTVALVGAVTFFVATVLFAEPDNMATLWSGIVLWLASAAFGATSSLIGIVSRLGATAVAVGSLLAVTGIDRLGLVSGAAPTIFNTLSQAGIVIMAVGWIVLGLDLGFRRAAAPSTR